jgi:uncharacterized metal-binding protein
MVNPESIVASTSLESGPLSRLGCKKATGTGGFGRCYRKCGRDGDCKRAVTGCTSRCASGTMQNACLLRGVSRRVTGVGEAGSDP